MGESRNHFRNFFRGIGSVLNIWPAPPKRRRVRHARRLTPWAQLCRDGAKVGRDLRRAIAKVR